MLVPLRQQAVRKGMRSFQNYEGEYLWFIFSGVGVLLYNENFLVPTVLGEMIPLEIIEPKDQHKKIKKNYRNMA